jgi:hypothetical protein
MEPISDHRSAEPSNASSPSKQSPPSDLFDLRPDSFPTAGGRSDVSGARAVTERSVRASAERRGGRHALLAATVFALALGAHFPLFLCALFAGASLIVSTTRQWPWPSRLLGTSVAALFAAQLTGVFITPFTVPLRFGFFFVLIGMVVAYVGSQLDSM